MWNLLKTVVSLLHKDLELIDAEERKEKAISQMLVLRIFFFNTIFIQDILPCAEWWVVMCLQNGNFYSETAVFTCSVFIMPQKFSNSKTVSVKTVIFEDI